ncbi:hypothetical protein ACFQ2M_42680 [Kitasatospora saccharophila]|uniref:hypothetical protein n=1 Tax=Kitasatospora saccharophila TaxID=407973 RepID=UPI003641FA12
MASGAASALTACCRASPCPSHGATVTCSEVFGPPADPARRNARKTGPTFSLISMPTAAAAFASFARSAFSALSAAGRAAGKPSCLSAAAVRHTAPSPPRPCGWARSTRSGSPVPSHANKSPSFGPAGTGKPGASSTQAPSGSASSATTGTHRDAVGAAAGAGPAVRGAAGRPWTRAEADAERCPDRVGAAAAAGAGRDGEAAV